MLNTEKRFFLRRSRKRLNSCTRIKSGLNKEKLIISDTWILDDHGFIYFPDFTFEPITHEDGRVYGMKMLGTTTGKILNEMPVYSQYRQRSCHSAGPATFLPGWKSASRKENEPEFLYPHL